ncbi:MAG: cell division protein SepF [Sciscionella sp.]
MGALRKLKAYFGMIPAEELDGYEDDYDSPPHNRFRMDAEPAYRGSFATASSRGDYGSDDRARFGGVHADYQAGHSDDWYQSRSARAPTRGPWGGSAPVRGALAVEPEPEPVAAIRQAPQSASRNEHPLSRITTLHPSSYNEARTIGEHYRDGIPVIMNLTEMEDADAKRLVDFAAGLAFAMRGSMDKVTNKVFLISPPDVDVTAEDRRRLAEGGFFARG